MSVPHCILLSSKCSSRGIRRFGAKRKRELYQQWDEDLLCQKLKDMINEADTGVKPKSEQDLDMIAEIVGKETNSSDGYIKQKKPRPIYMERSHSHSLRSNAVKPHYNYGSMGLASIDTSSHALPSAQEDLNSDEHNLSSFAFPIDQDSKRSRLKPRKNALFNEYSHDEKRKMQEEYQRKCYLNNKVMWQKMNFLPNPDKEAKLLMQENDRKMIESYGPSGISSLDLDDNEINDEKVASEAKRNEIASRIRTKIRHEKLANASVMKEKIPNVAGHVLDPIKFHIQRRTVRLTRLLQSHLEELLTWNSPKLLYGVLKGLAVSIDRIEMKTTRSICNVYYTISSEFDAKDAQKRLDIAAPVLRFQLARKLQLGYTPEFQFLHSSYKDEINKSHLTKIARNVTERRQLAGSVKDAWEKKLTAFR
ncbi:hypothetical protein IE077_004162 [Cardiosporidium cionae]|uniref:Uncharacterized protein n=1 Tax=Cardiosporidium cionae TaxID=476202 RepID=A0ABQ7J6Q0_9APIC|nr:hypothetical protein IE077_004162 [Cardiosporidium cionae]|eukprot:KAF8819652.1 hypothetical protein IE077_004162 [Cardiosporidium cionae]